MHSLKNVGEYLSTCSEEERDNIASLLSNIVVEETSKQNERRRDFGLKEMMIPSNTKLYLNFLDKFERKDLKNLNLFKTNNKIYSLKEAINGGKYNNVDSILQEIINIRDITDEEWKTEFENATLSTDLSNIYYKYFNYHLKDEIKDIRLLFPSDHPNVKCLNFIIKRNNKFNQLRQAYGDDWAQLLDDIINSHKSHNLYIHLVSSEFSVDDYNSRMNLLLYFKNNMKVNRDSITEDVIQDSILENIEKKLFSCFTKISYEKAKDSNKYLRARK